MDGSSDRMAMSMVKRTVVDPPAFSGVEEQLIQDSRIFGPPHSVNTYPVYSVIPQPLHTWMSPKRWALDPASPNAQPSDIEGLVDARFTPLQRDICSHHIHS